MRRILFVCIGTLSALLSHANDGSYYSHGGVIYPTKESRISLEKEILSFTVHDRMAVVEIYFEFDNPDATARKLLVGFQAPSAVGDVSYEASNSSQIYDFRVMQEGKLLPYELKGAECEDCELQDTSAINYQEIGQGLYVYLFEVTFQPGLNRIQHSYRFPASSHVFFRQVYNYILTTGSRWANSTIGDLTVQIDMGRNRYFFVSDIFGEGADWSIIGSGKVTDVTFEDYGDVANRMVRTLDGKLQVHVTDFSPQQNLEFGIINEHSFISWPPHHELIQSGEVHPIGLLHPDSEYSKATLRILRNTVYAQHGYAFRSEDLHAYFSQFAWYIPDPALKISDIQLSDWEKEFVEEVQRRERE